jgi:adenosylmethionine-8-amino-7-oxononanoate aminotransferase
MAHRFGKACIDAGVVVYPGQGGADGLLGDHALVTPPLTVSASQVNDVVEGIDRALTTLEGEL